MKVKVYGIDFELGSDERKVGDLIDLINDRGYIVTDIIADGERISNFSEVEIENINPIKYLELNTKKIGELIFDTLSEAKKFIPNFILSLDQISNNLTFGNEGDAYKDIAQALETLEWLNQLLIDLDNLDIVKNINKKEREDLINKWYEVFISLVEAFKNNDTVLMNDIIEYELKPVMEIYLKYVSSLKNNLLD